MKKFLNISVIAALAILPLAANAETGDPVHSDATTGITAEAQPKYALAPANDTVDGVVATAGYVKGAYNSAIKAINRVAETANGAVKGVQVNGDDLTLTNGIANVTVAESANNGKISVNGKDVAVRGLDTAAYAKATDFISSAAGAVKTGNIDNGQVTKEKLDTAVQNSLDAADNAANKDLGNLSTTGEAKIVTVVTSNAASGAYNSSTNYDTNTVGAAIKTLEGNAGNYATKTGVETTVTNALAGTKVDISGLDVTNGALGGSATASVPVVATWGATASTGNVSATVNLANVTTNVTLTGDTNPISVTVTQGAVAYPEN